MKIWRYLHYSKFVAMLNSESLHFSRADKFLDMFEGSYPINNQKKYSTIDNPRYTYESFKKYVAISCWHRNPDESEAMWRLYLNNSDGVAIVSDENTLKECLKDTEANVINVQYKNYRTDKIEDFCWFNAFEYKRKCFSHEREVRANIYRLPPSLGIVDGFPELGPPDGKNCVPEEGVQVEVDLSKLIKKIVITPTSQSWFKDIVKDTLVKYKHPNIMVCDSELIDDPVYPYWNA